MSIKSISEITTPDKVEIDLTGPQGNELYLLGFASQQLPSIGKSKEETETILEEMRSGDYENLITVFDRELGQYVDLFR